jgi:hypothetical protein
MGRQNRCSRPTISPPPDGPGAIDFKAPMYWVVPQAPPTSYNLLVCDLSLSIFRPLLTFSPPARWRQSAMFKSRCSARFCLQICLTGTSRWKTSNGEESFGGWPRWSDGDHCCCNGMLPLHLLHFKPPLSHGKYTRCKFPTNSHNDPI